MAIRLLPVTRRAKRTVLNESSSGGEGSVDKADMQRADTVSTSEHQTLVSPEEAPSRGETVDPSAPFSVDKGPVINAIVGHPRYG